MPHRLVVRRWLKRTLIYGAGLFGVYMSVYIWARLSGNLVECAWEIDTDETRTCWAPGGICTAPPIPVGNRHLMAFFSPANAIESWLPDSMKASLNLKRVMGIRFAGQFNEGEAARYLRIVLEHVQSPPGAFLGGEFDSAPPHPASSRPTCFGVVRYSMSVEDFIQWAEALRGGLLRNERAELRLEIFARGFIREDNWTNQPARLAIWWKDGVMTVREDYSMDYTPDWDTDRLVP